MWGRWKQSAAPDAVEQTQLVPNSGHHPSQHTHQPKGAPSPNTAPLSNQAVSRLYERPPSFTDFLPWVEYLPDSQSFLLESGVSLGALFELTPVGTEARTGRFMAELRDALQAAITEAVPELDEDPWVLQFYVQDEPSLFELARDVEAYVNPTIMASDYTRHYLALLRAHCARISRPGGLFEDTTLTGTTWRGQIRRVRAALYRRLSSQGRERDAISVEADLSDVATKFIAALAAAGVRCRRCGGEDLYNWLLPWFNPQPAGVGSALEDVLAHAPYPGDEALPFGADLGEALTLSMPRSDNSAAIWWFDDLPHTVVTVQGLRRAPDIGHVSAERPAGDLVFSLFDRLPEQTIMVLTLTIKPQDRIRNHIAQVKRAAVGDSAEAELTREDASAVEREMAAGNKLYPLSMAFYLRAQNPRALQTHINQLNALLLPNGLQTIGREADLLALDSYLRYLPMAYDPKLEKTQRRSRLVFSRHIANLLPLYGRSRGTGNPGMVFFNRGAEPLVFDPLQREDRKKNAHMLILGPTGAGKSALLVYLLQQMAAVHQPRIFIIEAGGSFSLLGQYFASQGLSVNDLALNPGTDVSLPPFADALRLLIRNAILLAAGTVNDAGRDQVLTRDVVAALASMARDSSLPEHRRNRALEMSDGMALFCSGLAGDFFDRPGNPWPEADVTILEMGMLAREGYEDQLTVAYISMMSHINDLVERHQRDARPTLVVTDEGHIITTNPLLARYVVKITKMWRKLGAWFWIATQNLEDFPDASRKMLNMMEWWLCLVMPKEEVEQIARFKDLSEEQRSLLLSARKEPGKYVEGVVLADNVEALFRSVPPPLTLALAMTEKHEKAERAQIMRERGCTELEAVAVVARRLESRA